MKNLKILIFLFSVLIISCKKEIANRTDGLAALAPSKIDTGAGSWKTILLVSPTEFAVAAPAAVTSAGYLAELNEIKGLQQNMNGDLRAKINYWAAGNVLRWNETIRGLVAKYNLAPANNDDGTYTIPSSANPFAYPLFPFANPPYSARAYAYISAAQYDALVATYYYKKLYNRPAPYLVDANVQALVTKTSLPSYPSEAAVVAGCTAEMMKLLFPTEIASIQLKADEAVEAAIASGEGTRSDMEAGIALGRLVAQKFTARAKTDNAGAAVGNATIWAALETNTIARGETPWISQESPKRPPMLPLFGKVKSLLVDSASMAALVPPPPPATKSAQMATELAEVKSYADNPTRDNIAIVHFWADGTGTPTPPGHWNDIACSDFVGQNFSEVRWARNLALLNITMMDAATVCWNTKYIYFNARPSQLDPSIKTLTGLPNFPSYISGHSTFSAAAATFLGHVLPANASNYNALAQQASLSRLYGALHYRSDCEVGLTVGKNTANYAVQRAIIDGAE